LNGATAVKLNRRNGPIGVTPAPFAIRLAAGCRQAGQKTHEFRVPGMTVKIDGAGGKIRMTVMTRRGCAMVKIVKVDK